MAGGGRRDGAGRPAGTARGGSEVMAARVPEAVAAQFDARALARGETRTEALRRLIGRAVADQPQAEGDVLAELRRLAQEAAAAVARAEADGVASCGWCGRERALAELEVDDDHGGLACVDLDGCKP